MRYWRKFYECSCMGEGVMLSFEQEEKKDDKLDYFIDLAFFQHGKGGKLSFRQRLRHCWYTLKNGTPFCDMVTLDKKTAGVLGKDLLAFSKDKKREK